MSAPYRREIKDVVLFAAKASTGTSTVTLDVSDFRDVVLSIAGASSANLTVKVQGALGVKGVDGSGTQGEYIAPDFSASATATNAWAYLQAVDLNTGNPIDGSTGISFTGTDAVYLVEVNTNAVDWLTVTVTARAAGNVTVKAAAVTNL